MTPNIIIPDRLVSHLLQGHPWLFADVIPEGRPPGKTGDFVNIARSNGRVVATALYEHGSPIPLRVLSLVGEPRPGEELWRLRLQRAVQLRRRVIDFSETDAFRLVHGEGDRLPGIVVDSYAGYLVLKLDTPAWLPHLDEVVSVLAEVAKPLGIWFRGLSDRKRRSKSPDSAARTVKGKTPPRTLQVRESGLTRTVDMVKGQKTGLFLDQRENRKLVGRMAKKSTVLDLFACTGGFSLAAAHGGATQVTCVDSAAPAVEAARVDFERNNIDPAAHEFVVDDVFDYLARSVAEDRTFDLVVVDPPSMAPSQKTLPKARSAYTALNEKAIRTVAPGGLLATASCSSHMTLDLFLACLERSAQTSRRLLRILEIRREPPDHPVPLHFPQGRYLKFVLATVE